MTPFYDDGTCQIVNGNCRDVVAALPDGCVDALITDPPYGLNIGYGRTALGLRRIEGDEDTDLLEWIAGETGRLLAPNAWAVIFCGFTQVGGVQAAVRGAGLTVKSVVVWDKAMPSLGEGIRNQYELVVLAKKGTPAEPWCGGNVWRVARPTGRPDHPHEKPIRLMRALVERYSPLGGLVFDPFMGSGSTLRAAKDCGRRALGVEVERTYCELAQRRLAQGSLFEEEAMPRTPGHKLIREAEEGTTSDRWRCECGVDLGVLSVHRARAAHRQHKETGTQLEAEAS